MGSSDNIVIAAGGSTVERMENRPTRSANSSTNSDWAPCRDERLTGVRPVGIRTPSWDFSANTLRIIQELGLRYDSSLMADDEPYEIVEDGEPTGVVEIPVEWIRDDAPYFNMDRYSGARPYTPPRGVRSTTRRCVAPPSIVCTISWPCWKGGRIKD